MGHRVQKRGEQAGMLYLSCVCAHCHVNEMCCVALKRFIRLHEVHAVPWVSQPDAAGIMLASFPPLHQIKRDTYVEDKRKLVGAKV